MIVESTRFGTLELTSDQAIDFGPGLLGFPASGTFVFIELPDDDHYLWLQSVDEPELAFLVTRPWEFFPDYEIDVPDAVTAEIELEDPVDSDVFLLLTVHRTNDEEPGFLTANLLGPVVVNTRRRLARQVVLDSDAYGTREPLVKA